MPTLKSDARDIISDKKRWNGCGKETHSARDATENPVTRIIEGGEKKKANICLEKAC